MIIGIIPNITKPNIIQVVENFQAELEKEGLQCILSEAMLEFENLPSSLKDSTEFLSPEQIAEKSDIVISIGGDGTMLKTAFDARLFGTPLLGVNFGKLGFLAEFDISEMKQLIQDIKTGDYVIEKRSALDAICLANKNEKLYAINDVVIDRGRYPKMIEITIEVDDEYVSTFSADGIIIATPTGSTGYSLSTGGPIVNPQTDAITLSPISPHTLTMRHLVISSRQKIRITADSPHHDVQIICDGSRVHYYKPPAVIEICRSKYDVHLVHKSKDHYFEILRDKLHWGIDLRFKEK